MFVKYCNKVSCMLMKTNRVLKTEDLVYRCGVEMKLFKYLEGGEKVDIYAGSALLFRESNRHFIKRQNAGCLPCIQFCGPF